MSLAICSLSSGSSGNCYLVKSNKVSILVDAGISCKKIAQCLESKGLEKPKAVLITHEHTDHTKGLNALVKEGVKVYISAKTKAALPKDLCIGDAACFNAGDVFCIGDIEVSSFSVSHDAVDPCGFSFKNDGKCISIITDTGYVTDGCFEYMRAADILVLESNHDINILKVGRYPWFLKQRILSDTGHLSNDAAAEAFLRVLQLEQEEGIASRPRQVLLAHLSKENNFEEMALATFENVIAQAGFNDDKQVKICVLKRDQMSCVYEA